MTTYKETQEWFEKYKRLRSAEIYSDRLKEILTTKTIAEVDAYLDAPVIRFTDDTWIAFEAQEGFAYSEYTSEPAAVKIYEYWYEGSK